ncbi:MAG: hypothetical protein NPIRA06_32730 [Nitrospirales bacterium]|nr:MAG: hypothetical protein NPIRA06_32730 [Nitrospirales bacterium]
MIFFVVVLCGLSGLSWAADTPLFGTFALLEVDKDWRNLPLEEQKKGGKRADDHRHIETLE